MVQIPVWMTQKWMSLTQVFLSEGIDGDSSGQEQGGQRGRFGVWMPQNRCHEKTCSYRRISKEKETQEAAIEDRLELIALLTGKRESRK